MKDNKDVIAEFNEYVNMTASELEKWLKSDDSNSAGWSKDGDGGESVGHDSGRQIVEILKANPDKTPDKYTDEQLQHMRKVASYCKRHLAQESASNKEKDAEEVKQTKSYVSLKNWGHDFLKAQGKQSSSSSNGGKSGKSGSKQQEEEEKDNDVQEDAEDEEMEEAEAEDDGAQKEDEELEPNKKAGDKRQKPNQQKGPNKKQETRKTRSATKKNASEDEDQGEQAEEDRDGDDAEEQEEEEGGDGDKSSKKGPKKGDTVSWSWGSGNPKGKVLDVKEDKATITTKNGNEVSRDGDPEDPAVILDAGKSKAIKSAHELN